MRATARHGGYRGCIWELSLRRTIDTIGTMVYGVRHGVMSLMLFGIRSVGWLTARVRVAGQDTSCVLPTCVRRTRRSMIADQESTTGAANKHWGELRACCEELEENAVKSE